MQISLINKKKATTETVKCLFGKPVWHICTFNQTIIHIFFKIGRLICLVALVSTVLASSLFVLDLTQFGDVEKNPGPNSGD